MIQETQKMLKFLLSKGCNVTDIAYTLKVREQSVYRWIRGVSIPHKVFFLSLQELVSSKEKEDEKL